MMQQHVAFPTRWGRFIQLLQNLRQYYLRVVLGVDSDPVAKDVDHHRALSVEKNREHPLSIAEAALQNFWTRTAWTSGGARA